jgi:hypothetical protein
MARSISNRNRGYTINSAGSTDLDNLLSAVGNALANTLVFPLADNVIVVDASGPTDVNRGTALLAAMAAARALLPTATKRATIIVPPGRYDLGTGDGSNHGLLLDTEYVDLVGVDPDRSHTVITSAIGTINRGTVEQTANDVEIRNLVIENTNTSYTVLHNGTDPAAYRPDYTWNTTHNGSGPDTIIKNVEFKDGLGSVGMRLACEYAGTYEDCEGGDETFGGYGTASGTFLRCKGGDGSFGVGGGGSGSGSGGVGGGTASGTFTDCEGGDDAFGGMGTASGTYLRCKGGDSAFGGYGTFSGTVTVTWINLGDY